MQFGWLSRLTHCAGLATSIINGYCADTTTNEIPQEQKQHKHLVWVSKCPQSALSASNELPTNLTSPVLLGSSHWAIPNLHKFYHLHELKATCCSIQTNGVVLWTRSHSFLHDVNFAFRDVLRIPRLLLATSNIVPTQRWLRHFTRRTIVFVHVRSC